MCTVLIVDDHPEVRAAVCDALTELGHKAEGVADGLEALEWLRSHPVPCLVIVDLKMPGMDGWDLVARIRLEPTLSSLGVIVCSEMVELIGPPPVLRAKAFWPKASLAVRLKTVHELCDVHRDSASSSSEH